MTTIHNNLRLLGKGVMGLLSRADVTATLSVLSLAAAPAFAGPEGLAAGPSNGRALRHRRPVCVCDPMFVQATAPA